MISQIAAAASASNAAIVPAIDTLVTVARTLSNQIAVPSRAKPRTTRIRPIQGPGLGSRMASPGKAAIAKYGSAMPRPKAANIAKISPGPRLKAKPTAVPKNGAEQGVAIKVAKASLEDGIPAFELFQQAGLAASKSEARRLIKGGGGRLNDAPIDNETQAITVGDVNGEGVIKLSAGKKRHALVRVV